MNTNKNVSPGVYTAKKKDGSIYYRASFTYKNKHISLGSYDDPDTAHRVYTSANLLVSTESIGINDYTPEQFLPFEKWIVIVNFRLVAVLLDLIKRFITYLHRIGAAGNKLYGSIVKVAGKLFHIYGGRGDDKAEILSFFQEIVQKAQNKVDIKAAFMGFVHNENFIFV